MARRYQPVEIAALVHAIDARPEGETICRICRHAAISRASYYRWKASLRDTSRPKSLSRFQGLSRRLSQREDEQQVLRAFVRTLDTVERRQAAVWARARFSVSRRMLKRAIGVDPESTLRPRSQDQQIASRMMELSRAHPEFGYRRLALLLRHEGVVINHKRAARIWREIRPQRPREDRRQRTRSPRQLSPLAAPWPSYCWSLDVTHYRTTDYRRLEFLTVLDDFSRLCILLRAARNIRPELVREALQGVFTTVGSPRSIRVDRQAAKLLRPMNATLREYGIRLRVTRGQTPAENAYIESFHATLARGFFGIYAFANVAHAQQLADDWREYYNERRPHSSLGYQTPRQFLEAARNEAP